MILIKVEQSDPTPAVGTSGVCDLGTLGVRELLTSGDHLATLRSGRIAGLWRVTRAEISDNEVSLLLGEVEDDDVSALIGASLAELGFPSIGASSISVTSTDTLTSALAKIEHEFDPEVSGWILATDIGSVTIAIDPFGSGVYKYG